MCDIFVLGSDISNNYQIWHGGAMEKNFLDEYDDRSHQGFEVIGFSPIDFAKRIRDM